MARPGRGSTRQRSCPWSFLRSRSWPQDGDARVRRWNRKQDPEELRETVVHELVHCHLAPLWAQLRQDLLSPFGQETYDAFLASVERNMEFGVDALSVALAKHMPLIDWNNTGEEYE